MYQMVDRTVSSLKQAGYFLYLPVRKRLAPCANNCWHSCVYRLNVSFDETTTNTVMGPYY